MHHSLSDPQIILKDCLLNSSTVDCLNTFLIRRVVIVKKNILNLNQLLYLEKSISVQQTLHQEDPQKTNCHHCHNRGSHGIWCRIYASPVSSCLVRLLPWATPEKIIQIVQLMHDLTLTACNAWYLTTQSRISSRAYTTLVIHTLVIQIFYFIFLHNQEPTVFFPFAILVIHKKTLCQERGNSDNNIF